MKTLCFRFVIIVLMLILFTGCSLHTVESETQSPVNDVTQIENEKIVSASAEVVAIKYATLSFMVGSQEYVLIVEEGDQLKDGDLVAYLAEDWLPEAIVIAQADIVGAQRDLDDLLISDTAQYRAEKAKVLAEQAVQDAKDDLTNESYPRGSENTIQGLQAALDLARIELGDAEEAYDKVDDRDDGDEMKALATIRLTDARKKVRDLTSQLSWYFDSSDPLDMSEKKVNLSLAEALLEDAGRELDRFQDGPDPVLLAVAKARVDALQMVINQKNLIAPFDGTVVKIYGHSGESILPGAPVILLADLSQLQVRTTDLSEIDIARIRIGNPVKITFDALPDIEVDGVVTKIALMNSSGADVNYTVTIDLVDPPAEIRWGMSAYVEILVDE